MTATEKLRGFVRASHRYTETAQRKRLADVECGAIYVHGKQGLDYLIRDLRKPRNGGKGDVVAVTSLSRLAPTRDALREAIDAIHGKGAIILEIGNKPGGKPRLSSDKDQLAEMIFDAVAELAQDRRTHSKDAAAKYGSKGGKKRAENLEAGRAPEAQALAAWRDLSYTTAEVLATPAMRGWSSRVAYARFGPRNTAPGARVGRPPKAAKR